MAKFVIGNQEYDCYIAYTLKFIGGKWKTLILWHLLDGTKRFSELKHLIPNCTSRMLTCKLRELENDRIINRKIYEQVPPKVEYSLTDAGETLRPILELACEWGQRKAWQMNTEETITTVLTETSATTASPVTSA